MKKLQMLVTALAFSFAILGAFAFQTKDHAKKFNVEAYAKSGGACTIDKGSVNCDTPITATACSVAGFTGPVYNSSCVQLYVQN